MRNISKTPYFPQELVDAIIDELKDDFDGLKAAGLVNSRWYPRTRAHLFRKIHIEEKDEHSTRAKLLAQLLEVNPSLATRVRGLSLENDDRETESEDGTIVRYRGWMVESAEAIAAVIKILPMLKFLNHLAIVGCSVGLSWPDIPEALRNGLLGIMSQPSVSKLELEAIDNLSVSTIGSLVNLQELSINVLANEGPELDLSLGFPGGMPAGHTQAVTGPEPGDSRLLKLELGMSGSEWRDLLLYSKTAPQARHFLYPKLVQLDLTDWDESMVVAWSHFLALSAPYVEGLSLNFDAFAPLQDRSSVLYPLSVFNFIRFTQLRTLVIKCRRPYLHVDECNPLPDFINALEALADAYPTRTLDLEHIVIMFKLQKEDEEPEPFYARKFAVEISGNDCWYKLSDVLCRDPFQKVRREGVVQISFAFDDGDILPEEWRFAEAGIYRALYEVGDALVVQRDG